jgi:hypothetical protein
VNGLHFREVAFNGDYRTQAHHSKPLTLTKFHKSTNLSNCWIKRQILTTTIITLVEFDTAKQDSENLTNNIGEFETAIHDSQNLTNNFVEFVTAKNDSQNLTNNFVEFVTAIHDSQDLAFQRCTPNLCHCSRILIPSLISH